MSEDRAPYGVGEPPVLPPVNVTIPSGVREQVRDWRIVSFPTHESVHDPTDHDFIVVSKSYIATLEAALLGTWYDGEYDKCRPCEALGVGSEEIEHAPDCIIPSIERQAPTS